MNLQRDSRETIVKSMPWRSEVVELLLNPTAECGLTRSFEKPNYFYSTDWPELDEKTLVPLWEHFEAVYCVDIKSNPIEFIAFFIEFPAEYDSFKTIDQMLFHMIELYVWEYGGEEQEAKEALEFAKRLRMPNIEQLALLLNDHLNCDEDMINSYKNSI